MMYCCVMYLSCQFSSSWLVFVLGLGIDCSIRAFDCEGFSDGKRDMPWLLKYDGVSCYLLPALCDFIFLGPNLDSLIARGDRSLLFSICCPLSNVPA